MIYKIGFRIGVIAAIIFNVLDYLLYGVIAANHRIGYGHWPKWTYKITIWGTVRKCHRCEVGGTE